MVEPVSIVCGVLYAGLGKVLWDGAAKVGDQALGGLIGNRTDAAAVAIGQALRGRLLARRGLSENHDIARALRRAQIVATGFVIEAYARGAGANPPVAFLAGVRAGLKAAHQDLAALQWDKDVEAAMFASYQQAFRAPQDADDPDLIRAGMAEQTTLVAWAEVEQWADGAHAPDRLKQRFFGQASQIVGFHDAWCGEVVEAMKTDERFKTIFVADKLVEIGDIVIDGRAVLARLEDATEGVREQLGEMERWLAEQFDEQRGLHHQTHEMLRRLEESMRAQGRTLAPDEREAVETTLEDVAASTGEDLEQARAGLSDEDPIALIDGLEAAASHDAAKRLRQAGAIAYAVDVVRALRIYGKVAALEPRDHWTHVLLSRLHIAAGDLTAAANAAKLALASAEDERDRMVALGTLGDLAQAEGDLPGARQAYENALLIARDLSARAKNTEWLRDLSISYERIGDVAIAEGDLPRAAARYRESLPIVERLATLDPSNAQWVRDVEITRQRLAEIEGTPA
ncbi:MAG: tetratricopeptide repeat protein [Brevundimonas sp.]|nr:tetratricopeptide repeat protein [Brevundimonas sp.]